MLWEEILSGEFEAAVKKAKGLCAIVVGCMEQHGHHLPIGQDVIFTQGIAERAAKKVPFVLFPSMYFGEKTGAGEFPGTVIFSAKLRFDILKESCDEIARNGFHKIVLINGHGGNTAMLNNFARSVLFEKKNYMVFVYNIWTAWPNFRNMLKVIDNGGRAQYPELLDEDIAAMRNYVRNKTASGHGCMMETAMTLGIRPDLVDLSRVSEVDGRSVHRLDHIEKAQFYSPLTWMANFPNSYSSDAHEGNSERIGRTAVKITADNLAAAMKVIKEDTACEEYLAEWLKKQK